MKKLDRLFGDRGDYDPDELVDILYVYAIRVEYVFLQAGAKPDVDYNYKDIMELSIKLFVAMRQDF